MEKMSRKKLREFVIIMAVTMIMGMNECCIESERTALLEIKSYFNPNSPYLSSWGSLSDDCCEWNYVTCTPFTEGGRVAELFLSKIRDVDSQENWYLNSSMFLPFQHLNELNLRLNNIAGCIHNQGFERLSALANLEFINLSGNKFNNTILRSLSGLHSLKYLYLTNNELKGTIDISELGNLTCTLEVLDFSGNGIEGLKTMEGLNKLEKLYLDYNQFNETTTADFLQSIERITSLKTLSLRRCGLNAKPQGLCNLKYLEDLDISYSDLNGDLPLCLRNMSSLQSLDISNTRLQIPISLTPFFNLSKLISLDVSNNTIYEDTGDHNSIPKFQLHALFMFGYGEGGILPKFLYHQHNLVSVYISNMKLRGGFPCWMLQNNTRLQTLELSNNSFSGSIQLPNRPHANLLDLYISDNFFNESIPSKIGISFPSLESLVMYGNRLQGSIPDSLCHMPALVILDLSNNNISGSLPPNCSPSNVEVVNLSKNKIQGSLKEAFYSSRYLIQLDLSHNNFSRTIPSSFGELSELRFLVLRFNNFQGKIPVELCKLKKLSFLDLSHNNFIGHMIPCLNLTNFSTTENGIRFIEDIEITMKGQTYMYKWRVLLYLSGIDISCNNMTANIPPEMGNLTSIKELNFSRNYFTGEIPSTFSNLKEIESLDLSFNNLQGSIPAQLTQLTSLSIFNVSYNNLSGVVPNAVYQFGTFSESSYKGNPFLCGSPLSKICGSPDSHPSNPRISPDSDNSKNKFIDMEDFFLSFGISYGTVLLTLDAILCINPYWRRVWFYYVQMSIDKTYYFFIDNVISL